jgi:colanic acid biosynthesis glycosyl transferase WcaI
LRTRLKLADALGARLVRRPLLLEIRDLWPDQVLPRTSAAFGPVKAIERLLYRSARTVSVLTPQFVPHVSREGGKRVRVVVRGADLSRFTPGPKPMQLIREMGLEGHFVVGYPGTLGTSHDIDLIAQVGTHLRGHNVKLVFVGGGPFLHRLKALVAGTCPEVFTFVPMQPAERMPEWWRAFDAGLVLLRQNRALARVVPSKMFEAMATGTPIIFVGPKGAGSQIVEQAAAGPVVDDGDPQSVTNAILRLASDQALRQRYGACAREAAPQFSRERHAQETLELLRGMAAMG